MHNDTPRTDENAIYGADYSMSHSLQYVVDADFARELERENAAAREALALAHAILAKISLRDVAHAAKRAAIKHEGNAPMAYIAGVLANAQDQTDGRNKL